MFYASGIYEYSSYYTIYAARTILGTYSPLKHNVERVEIMISPIKAFTNEPKQNSQS